MNSFDVEARPNRLRQAVQDHPRCTSTLAIFAAVAIAAVLVVVYIVKPGSTPSSPTTATTTIAAAIATTTFGATTTTTFGPRSKSMTSKAAADYLNKLYAAFTQEDETTPVGVTISMAAQVTGFFANIFCSSIYNPAVNGYTSCFQGQADCRLSTAVLSKGWMTDNKTKGLASFGGRAVGFVLNQTMVQEKWTKCSYIWDGASFRLYNRGCGDGAPSIKCGPTEKNAFNNKCGENLDHTCTAADDEVSRKICNVAGGSAPVPTVHDKEPECLFPGPAFDYHGQDDYKPWKDFTREMAKQRLKYNYGEDSEGPNTEKNNEIVLDEELLLHDIWKDPIAAIPAIVYTTKTNKKGINKKFAQGVRDDLCNNYGCTQHGGALIPLVRIDDVKYQRNGPFFPDTDDELIA